MEKRFYWLYVSVFFNILSFGLIFPIIPLFAEHLNASSFVIGMLSMTVSLSQFFVAPISGRLSDRYGRKPILLVSIFINAISSIIIGSSSTIPQVLLGMVLQGVGSAGVFPIAIAYIADVTDGHNRSKYISRVTGTFALGFMVGPAIGGLLGSQSLSLPFYMSGITGILTAVGVGLFLHESHHERDKKLAIKEGFINVKALYRASRGEMGALLLLLFSWAFYIGNFNLATPFFMQQVLHFNMQSIGIFFSAVGLMAAVTQWVILPIVEKKIGDMRTIFLGGILLSIGAFMVPFSNSPVLFYTFFAIAVLGSASVRPSINAMLSKRTIEGQGSTMGLAFSFESFGRMVSPLVLGFIIGKFGLQLPFWTTAMVIFLSILIFWKVEMKK